jgi:hypothetical protein
VNFDPMQFIIAQGFELPRSAAHAGAPSSWMAVSDMLAILAAGLAVAIPVVGWILYAKKRRRTGHHHHRHDHTSESASQAASEPAIEEAEDAETPHRHHRRRIRRRDHRPRNPTLAETGGLPPMREADSTPPPPSL